MAVIYRGMRSRRRWSEEKNGWCQSTERRVCEEKEMKCVRVKDVSACVCVCVGAGGGWGWPQKR